MERSKILILLCLIFILPVFWGCREQNEGETSGISLTLTISLPGGFADDGPLGKALGTLDDIDRVTVDVKEGEEYLISAQEIPKTSGTYTGVLTGLPVGPSLTFIGHAYNESAVEIYSNLAIPLSQTLTGTDDSVTLLLASIDDLDNFELAQKITKIEHESKVERAHSLAVRIWVSNSSDATLDYELSGPGFSFLPDSGSVTTANQSGVFVVTATALSSVGAGDYPSTVKLVNGQGNFVETLFTIEIENPYLLPDTGQSADTTATWGEDSDYPINTPSLTDNGNGTVTDDITGLIWQQEDDGQLRTQVLALDYCDNLSLGGYADWRLPSVLELKDIVDYGRTAPTLDTSYFTNTSNANYWTSTTYPNNANKANQLSFESSIQGGSLKNDPGYQYYSRCVRGLEVIFGSVQNDGNSTITDRDTKLSWQQGEGGERDWESALTYCEGLSLGGETDWRLPNAKELQSILDYTVLGSDNPKMNPVFFPDATTDNYWSSTPSSSKTSKAWRISFKTSIVKTSQKTKSDVFTRCVRNMN